MHATGWFGMWILLFWFFVTIAFVMWIKPRITPEPRSNEGRAVAEEILRERLARGEINREQFHRSLEDLRK